MSGPERPQEPYRIITDKPVEIISPIQGKRIYVSLSPNGALLTRMEDLTQPEERRLEAETQFTNVVRPLIVYSLENQAVQARPGSEEIGPELAALDWDAQFQMGVASLEDIHLSNKQIREMIINQGKQFTAGQEHMGFMPSTVSEQVVRLNRFVDDYFIEKARQQSQPQRGRHSR